MPRIDESIGRGAKKLLKGAKGVFTQKAAPAYDPTAANYAANADFNYGIQQGAEAGAASDQNEGRSLAADARALNTTNADQSRATAMGDRSAAIQGAQAIQGDAGRVRGVGGQMVDYANQGPGASAAEAQLKQSTDRNMAQAVAMARSGRGGTGGGLALRQADQQRAQAQTDAAAQGATLRAQEADAWRGRQLQALQGGASAYGAAGGLEGSATSAYQAQQGADQAQQGLDMNQQQIQQGQTQMNDAAALGWEEAAQSREGQQAQWAAMDQAGRMAYEQDKGGNIMDARLAAAGYDAQRDSGTVGTVATLGTAAMMMSDINAKKNVRRESGIAQQQGGLLGGLMSDVKAKKHVRRELNIPQQSSGLGGMVQGLMGKMKEKDAADVQQSRDEGKASGEAAALSAAAAAPGYSYEYKDPQKHGEGRYVGPMAQDLESTPVGATVVQDTPDGKQIDTSRLSLVNTAAISEQQRQIDEMRRKQQQAVALGGPQYG